MEVQWSLSAWSVTIAAGGAVFRARFNHNRPARKCRPAACSPNRQRPQTKDTHPRASTRSPKAQESVQSPLPFGNSLKLTGDGV